MCDTVAAITADGAIFAKNSDREANEAQSLEWIPALTHDVGEVVRATHVTLAQVAATRAAIISRPWWMFGAEMGVNDAGVAIGNEAVYTTEPYEDTGLLGMDIVRLVLERAGTAHEAVGVIVDLIERVGQGGACSVTRPDFTYHNSFLVVDATAVIVVESAGRYVATEEVRSGVRAISNGLTIPDFAEKFADRRKDRAVSCEVRRHLTESDLTERLSRDGALAALRDHGGTPAPRWHPLFGSMHAPCVHAGGLMTSSQTVGSLVVELNGSTSAWATATSSPCLSAFKPVAIDEPVDLGPIGGEFDADSYWWRHEQRHRQALRRGDAYFADMRAEIHALETRFATENLTSSECFELAEQLVERGDGEGDVRPRYVATQWARLNKDAQMP